MLIIGLTGPSGAGKGTFGKLLGLPYLDTDRVARRVVEKGTDCLKELQEHFGDGILLPDGSLDRKKLGNIAFSNPEQLTSLNHITHKYISREVSAWLTDCKNRGEAAAVIDAPQLFESGEDALCDVTVAVLADPEIRLARIMQRDGISEEYAKKRMASQKSDDFFRTHCTFIIENNRSDSLLKLQADDLLRQLGLLKKESEP